MKRFTCFLLILSLTLTQIAVFSEEKPEAGNDFFGSIGGFLGSTWDSASSAAGDAWNSASSAAGDVWNSASIAAEDAWNGATTAAGEAWDWTKGFVEDQYGVVSASTEALLNDLKTWVYITGDGAIDTLYEVFTILASELGIAGDKAAELWNSTLAYAKENGIDVVVIAKLMLAIMVRLTLGRTLAGDMAGEYISDTIIVWFSDNGINSQEAAENALSGLEASLVGE